MVAPARITIRFLLLFQTAKIERNETVARKDARFKLPICCHYRNTC